MSWLKRPIFPVVLIALSACVELRARGRLDPPIATLRPVELGLLARVAGPLREDLRGEKVVVTAGRYRFLARLPKDPEANARLRPGMLLRLAGRLRPGREARNPGDFDEARFLSDRGLSGVVEARSASIEAVAIPPSWLPRAWAEDARRSLQDCLRRRLSPDEARVMEGLMLGYKGALPRALNRALQDAGVMHLVVPSGAKVALVLALCALLCRPLPLGFAARCLFCAAVGGFYVLMVGGEAPYARAYLTAVAYFGARLLGREADAPQALALSSLIIVLLDPRAPFSAGFQMTYAAAAGLALVLPRLAGRSRLGSALIIGVVVQLALWPVFANVFGKGSLAAPLANLACGPLAAALATAGFALKALDSAGLGTPAAMVVAAGARLFMRACFFFASPGWAGVPLSPMPPTAVVGYYVILAAALTRGSRRARACLAGLGLCFCLSGAAAARLSAPLLRVVYFSQPRGRVAALVFFDGRDPWLVGRAPASLLERALLAEGASRVARIVDARAFRACAGAVCCAFAPPAVGRAKGEFDILAPRLKASAVEVATDGSHIEIRSFRRQADQLGRAFL